MRPGFIERSVESLAETLGHARLCEDTAAQAGWLQGVDPRVKLCGLMALLLAAVSARRFAVTMAILLLGAILAKASGIGIRTLAVRTWLGVLLFTGFIALPAIFLTPGQSVGLGMTRQGLMAAARLIARAETGATMAALLVMTTPWTHVLKALRTLRVPALPVIVLGMTYRYIFLLLRLAQDFFEARRSRLFRPLSRPEQRHMAGAAAGMLLHRSMHLSEDVYLAMQSRGFRGEAYTIDDFHLTRRDWLAAAGFALVAALAFWGGFA
ncbi:MAG TPA: cobalt ECF transporter T component CbiQ [Chthoniobacteraceae bacterium]|jgi:cobalt ECF transporter T component CbiQ|nr:cobalt ECF transporter T component CbiQ [Chthoniobacteraceae bacterium]